MFRDFKELLSAFNAQRVRYLIVGGYADQRRYRKLQGGIRGIGAVRSPAGRAAAYALATRGAAGAGHRALHFVTSYGHI